MATNGGLKIEDLAASFHAHEKMHKDAIYLYPELKFHSVAFLMDVCLLKYNEAKKKVTTLDLENSKQANEHLKYIRKFTRDILFLQYYVKKFIGKQELHI